MSLATYASPFEIETSEGDVNVLYSKNKDDRGKRNGDKNKTRRSIGDKKRNRDITNIIQMLHEDMSDNEDAGETLRSTPNMTKEGMVNFEDSYDSESSQYLREAIDKNKNTFNYSQKAMMEKEHSRLRNGMNEGVRSPAFLADRSVVQQKLMADPNAKSSVSRLSSATSEAPFSRNEMEYVSSVGGNLSNNEVSGDSDGVFYADTRNKPLMNRLADNNHLLDKNRSDPYEGSRRILDENHQQKKQREINTYDDSGEQYNRYDTESNDTYKKPSFQSECNYDLNENCGFNYPRWATRKNRRLHQNLNKKEIQRTCENSNDCDPELNAVNHDRNIMSSGYQQEVERLMKKMDYMIHMMEENEETKNGYVIEELILYCFLGFFVLFIVDSFTNVQVKYRRVLN